MLLLSAIRLVRWYHFADQIIQLDGHTLLAGLNGSGKSTIQDAVQLVMTGDQSMVRFNRAANDRTKRSTYGYVRHEVQLEQATGGRIEYRRPGCTGWIACQFHDPDDPSRLFTSGLVLDAADAQKSVDVGHFILPGRVVDTLPIYQTVPGPGGALGGSAGLSAGARVVRNKADARRAIREADRNGWLPDAQTYRRELRQRLGVRSEKFHRHLIQAAAYQPVDDLRRFVSEYLAEPRPVQTAALVENLEHLRQFAAEARRVEEQVAALDEVCAKGDEVAEARRQEERATYVLRRAEVHQTADAVAAHAVQLREQVVRRSEASLALERATAAYKARDRELEELIELLGSDPDAQRVSDLERRRDDAVEQLERSRLALDDVDAIVNKIRNTFDALTDPSVDGIRSRLGRRADEAPFFIPGGETKARRLATHFGPALGTNRLAVALAEQELKGIRDDLHLAATRLGDQALKLRREGEALHVEEGELQRGRQSYRPEVEGLLAALEEDLRGRRPARPLCELVDVPDPAWQDAAEVALGGYRTSIIVDPADFDRAQEIYRNRRSGVRLRDGRHVTLFGVGVVNLAGVERDMQRRPVHPRSLAHQLATRDPLARLYIDYLLGDMVCCLDYHELKEHRRAIEPGCMRYQQHQIVQFERDARPLIGAGARQRRLEQIGERLAQLNPELTRVAADIERLRELLAAVDEARDAGRRFETAANDAERVPDLENLVATLERQLASIDRGRLEELLEEKAAKAREREAAQRLMLDENAKVRAAGERIEAMEKEAPLLAEAQGRAVSSFEKAFGTGEPGVNHPEFEEWYLEARARVGSAAEVHSNYTSQLAGVNTRLTNLRLALGDLRTRFNATYGHDLPFTSVDDFEAFREYRGVLRDTRMREYQERIERERERALEHLANDIVQQLSTNFRFLQSEFALLNDALRKRPFNGDRYEFTKEVQQDMAYFYETVEEAQRIDTSYGSLWEAAQRDDLLGLRARLADMLQRLTAVQGKAAKDELERFIDYRAYFTYDIRIHKASGGWQSYNKVFGTGSGGQTQTPYYVAILSAMRALYTSGGRHDRPDFGLVMLDEAFKALDGPRIEAVVRFARSLGLQLLLATPLDRVQLISPHVDRTQLVIWDDGATTPVVLDYTKSLHDLATGDVLTSPGAAPTSAPADTSALALPESTLSGTPATALPATD